MKKISSNHILTFVIIPLLLFLLWFILSLFFASKSSFSVISSAYDRSSFTSLKTDELLAKQKVSAQFKARENNLGIISVRFKTYSRINSDKVIFKLKDAGGKEWLYENTYKVDQFQDNDYFTFGFPIISNSKGKTYYFEINSIEGRKGDAVSISTTSPVFIAQYQFTKQELFGNKRMIPAFSIKKIFYSFSDINFVLFSFVYLQPLIFYVIWCYLARPLIKIRFDPVIRASIANGRITLGGYGRKKYLLFYNHFIVILILVLFMNETNNYAYMILIGIWILLIIIYRLESSVSFLLGLFFLLLCPVLVILNKGAIAENAAIWAYFFLVIGTVEAIVEITKKLQNMISYDVFLKGSIAVYLNKDTKKE